MASIDSLRDDVVAAAQEIVASSIMPKSNHGNVSLRVPDSDKFLLTAGGSLASMKPENVALFDLEGNLLEGTVEPVGAEIIQMHGIVYRTRPEFGGVIHTHSPFATGFAVAGRPIDGAYEALVRNGFTAGVPVAPYGPRGSDQSVQNIAGVLKQHDGIRGLLLANHGVLAFGASPTAAVRANLVIEEAAEIVLNAIALGGVMPIPAGMVQATQARAASFTAAGTYST